MLDQYERKTLSERMTVSLADELKIREDIKTGPDGKKIGKSHEIMDIKKDFQAIVEQYNQMKEILDELVKIEIVFEDHSIDKENFN